ncbi:hypothetical protein Glove_85g111 [Diversispora epigaea]|uniref:Uncharacterized protein n=1 Tax=Diversispora epigaea TaxID=1348612 RepID=A0A397JAN6_9GLOM|nr:hypothetical protein Glove_85g111 [Diversispora epigaea]
MDVDIEDSKKTWGYAKCTILPYPIGIGFMGKKICGFVDNLQIGKEICDDSQIEK